MVSVDVSVHGEWVSLESLPDEQQEVVRGKVAEKLQTAITEQIKILNKKEA